MILSKVLAPEAFDSDRPERVVLQMQTVGDPNLYHYLYLTPEEVQQIVAVDRAGHEFKGKGDSA